MMTFVFDRVEIIAGKRRKCWLPTFSPFPTILSNSFLLRVVKSRDCVVELNALLPMHDVLINAREDVGFQNKTSEKDSCKHNSDPGFIVPFNQKISSRHIQNHRVRSRQINSVRNQIWPK